MVAKNWGKRSEKNLIKRGDRILDAFSLEYCLLQFSQAGDKWDHYSSSLPPENKFLSCSKNSQLDGLQKSDDLKLGLTVWGHHLFKIAENPLLFYGAANDAAANQKTEIFNFDNTFLSITAILVDFEEFVKFLVIMELVWNAARIS